MIKYRIYTTGNYLLIEDNNTHETQRGFKKEVFVDKSNTGVPVYRFFNVKDWDFKNSLKIEQILKQDGSPYTQNEWETFYTENTGNFNTGSEADPQLQNLFTTTLLSLDGKVEINVSDNTKFDFPAGEGVIVDCSVHPPIKTYVKWDAFVGETTPFLTISPNTFLAIDVNKNLVKTQDLQGVRQTPEYIIVGWVEHTNGVIERVGTEPYYNLNLGQQFQQLLETIGAFNVDGNAVSPNGTNRQINISAGTIVDNGLGFSQNKNAPNHYTSPNIERVNIKYFYRDGSGGWVNNSPFVNEVDTTHYDNGSGTLQTIPSGKWLLQRVFYYAPFGYLDVYHSQDYYNSLESALDAYNRGGFVDNDYISYDIPVAIIAVRHGTTNLSDTSSCVIRKASSSNLGGSPVSNGEVNTASNIGTSGVGIFKQKIGVDLEFKKLDSSAKISITDNPSTNTVLLTVNEHVLAGIPQTSVTDLVSDLQSKQPLLESGLTIKKINNESLLGQGNLTIDTVITKHFPSYFSINTSNQWYTLGGGSREFFNAPLNPSIFYGNSIYPSTVPSYKALPSLVNSFGKPLKEVIWCMDYGDYYELDLVIVKVDNFAVNALNHRFLNYPYHIRVLPTGTNTNSLKPYAKYFIRIPMEDAMDTPSGAFCSSYHVFIKGQSMGGFMYPYIQFIF